MKILELLFRVVKMDTPCDYGSYFVCFVFLRECEDVSHMKATKIKFIVTFLKTNFDLKTTFFTRSHDTELAAVCALFVVLYCSLF